MQAGLEFRLLSAQSCVFIVIVSTTDNWACLCCRYVAAMNVPGGGKNDIPNRLKRQFANFHVPQPSTAALNNIFGALVQVGLSLQNVPCHQLGTHSRQTSGAADDCIAHLLFAPCCIWVDVCISSAPLRPPQPF